MRSRNPWIFGVILIALGLVVSPNLFGQLGESEEGGDSSPSNEVRQVVFDLLRHANPLPRMRDVPTLNSFEEGFLVNQYAQTSSITNKDRIIRILAYGGSSKVVNLVSHAVTGEFAGRSITKAEEGLVVNMLWLLGIAAKTNRAALDFLLSGVTTTPWRDVAGWEVTGDHRMARYSAFRGSCLDGLVISGSEAGKRLRETIRKDPLLAKRLALAGSMVSSAYLEAMIGQYGLEAVLDQIWHDPYSFHSRFSYWTTTTPEGKDWWAWSQKVRSLGRTQPNETSGGTVDP